MCLLSSRGPLKIGIASRAGMMYTKAMSNLESVDNYCQTHDLFDCPYAHAARMTPLEREIAEAVQSPTRYEER